MVEPENANAWQCTLSARALIEAEDVLITSEISGRVQSLLVDGAVKRLPAKRWRSSPGAPEAQVTRLPLL